MLVSVFAIVVYLKIVNDQREQALNTALQNVRQLSGLLPMCAKCKSIRDGNDYWHRVETYIHEHSDVQITHSLCPPCIRELYPDLEVKAAERASNK
jgi:hypothetical protein